MDALAVSQSSAATPAALVAECELAGGLGHLSARPGITAVVLVRLFSEPIEVLQTTLPADGLSAVDLAHEIACAMEPQLRRRFEEVAWSGQGSSRSTGSSRRARRGS